MKLKIHSGLVHQRGGGIFSIIKSFVLPIFKKLGRTLFSSSKRIIKSPIVKDIAKTARDSVIEAGLKSASDMLSGQAAPESINQNVVSAKKKIAESFKRASNTDLRKGFNLDTASKSKIKSKKKYKTSYRNHRGKQVFGSKVAKRIKRDLFISDDSESN